MGTWAYEPWDNDQAADWFGSFMDRTRLRDEWLEGIKADPVGDPDIVRAAAALFVMLGRVYVWPIEHYEHDLELSIASLEAVAATDETTELPQLVAAIDQELAELRSRRKPSGNPSVRPQGPGKPWWRFW